MDTCIFQGYTKDGEIAIPVIWICDCDYLATWMGCLYAYKGLLLILGLFLAWETRNVNFPGLNDSKQIGTSVYNVVLCASVAAPLEFALKERNVNVSFALSGTAVIVCTSFTLGLLFFTKVSFDWSIKEQRGLGKI